MYKVDFHTHSSVSPDGGIKPEQYLSAIENGLLDCIAITDHNSISMAVELQKTLGEKIIVGEEIMTSEGELIGLFLTKIVNAGMTAEATAKAIKAQNGLVYVPHPFETVRKGVSLETLDQIADLVDIMEVNNGRALLQNHGPAAAKWARLSNTAGVASSDAHGYKGLGTTYTILKELPSCENLMSLLPMARMIASRPPLKTLLYPKANRLRKLLIKR